ncbi:MAG TPA: 16S rRNA (cytidine(1402)-2'-O)-methyltransferase, partial [Clostridia bacterium]|nr:16S rRNA (cytidine(1402)-2'-O)-methyltransferase [Clostridia bacterium]
MSKGTLYLCATPIGNLEDITLRAINVLKSVDAVLCEDTRRTIKLLNHFDIKKPLISYHEHNAKQRNREILDKLHDGMSLALVSDAGMPCISDPGASIVSQAISEGIAVTVIPGACAAVAALAVSGLDAERFVFEGFLPEKQKLLNMRLQ